MRLSYKDCLNHGGCRGITVGRTRACGRCGSRWPMRVQLDGAYDDDQIALGLAVFFTWVGAGFEVRIP